ncbi:MAG: AAA family ATPase, partial [Synergistaceae bacterium]|nr:AAA family ATPase [Synergistaceae bacterium]
NINGQIMSIQWISEDGEKRYFEGAGLDGAFWECWLYEAMEENPKNTILLGEGFATMLKIFQLMQDKPVVAAMSCYQLAATAKILREKYPEAKIIITADNDHQTERKHGKNPGLIYATNAKKSVVFGKPLADEVIYPEFKPDENGSDWDDYAVLYGNDITRAKLNDDITRALMPENIREMLKKDRLRMVVAQELRTKEFEPIKWAVPGFLPSGLSILGGPPKAGKSILALELALGVSIGGYVLGKIKVEQGDVLYLALEDNERRLQDRIASSNNIDENDDLSHLTLAYTVPRQNEGGIEFIDWWLKEHPNARLVIIDTLQRFRKQLSNKANVYAEDYDVLMEIKRIADKYDVAILLLHHLKKVSPKNEMNMDWIDLFSGSAGISGSADALFVLKRARQSVYGKLFRTGRDVEEKEFGLKLDGFGWLLEESVETFILPEGERKIFEYLKEHEKVSPLELSNVLQMNINTAKTNLTKLLKRGLVVKVGYGTYSLKKEEEDEC